MTRVGLQYISDTILHGRHSRASLNQADLTYRPFTPVVKLHSVSMVGLLRDKGAWDCMYSMIRFPSPKVRRLSSTIVQLWFSPVLAHLMECLAFLHPFPILSRIPTCSNRCKQDRNVVDDPELKDCKYTRGINSDRSIPLTTHSRHHLFCSKLAPAHEGKGCPSQNKRCSRSHFNKSELLC